MMFLGVDPGATGAWALLTDNGSVVHAEKYTNVSAFAHYWQDFDLGADHIFGVIEESRLPMLFNPKTKSFIPRKGSQEFANNLGKWEGALEVLNIPHQMVRPQQWQKAILGSVPKGKSKEWAFDFVTKRYPLEKLKKSQDGIIDAICIALFAQKLFLNGKSQSEHSSL